MSLHQGVVVTRPGCGKSKVRTRCVQEGKGIRSSYGVMQRGMTQHGMDLTLEGDNWEVGKYGDVAGVKCLGIKVCWWVLCFFPCYPASQKLDMAILSGDVGGS